MSIKHILTDLIEVRTICGATVFNICRVNAVLVNTFLLHCFFFFYLAQYFIFIIDKSYRGRTGHRLGTRTDEQTKRTRNGQWLL